MDPENNTDRTNHIHILAKGEVVIFVPYDNAFKDCLFNIKMQVGNASVIWSFTSVWVASARHYTNSAKAAYLRLQQKMTKRSEDLERKFKVALVQMRVTKTKSENLARARDAIQEAASSGAKLCLLPEMFNCPYGNDSFPAYAEPREESESMMMLAEAAKENSIVVVGGSIPEEEKLPNGSRKLYNTSYVFNADGELVDFHRKMHLFDIDIPGKIVFKESETLSPGNKVTVCTIPIKTEAGNLYNVRLGLAICYDIRFPELAFEMQRQGVEVICAPGAFNMTTGPDHWSLLLCARALDAQSYVLACSPARAAPDDLEAGTSYVAYGHSLASSPWGEIICEANAGPDILYAVLDLDRMHEIRANIPINTQRRLNIAFHHSTEDQE